MSDTELNKTIDLSSSKTEPTSNILKIKIPKKSQLEETTVDAFESELISEPKKLVEKNIDWNIVLIILLFQCVLQKGAHVANKAKVTESWTRTAELFYGDPIAVKELKLKKDSDIDPKKSIRKFKAKFDQVVLVTQKQMGWGDSYGGRNANLSGKSGDQSELHKLVKQVLIEIEDNNDEQAKGIIQKKKLANITTNILDPLGLHNTNKKIKTETGVTMGLNGEKVLPTYYDKEGNVVIVQTPKNKGSSFEATLLEILTNTGGNISIIYML